MIARAIANISASMAPSDLLNCGTRTSSAARSVMSTIPVPRGSTTTIRSRRLASDSDDPRIGHRCPDHPDRLEESAARADELVIAGDDEGAAVWRRITAAVAELTNTN